ncbi:RNA 2',3'-cyclic phosphodiesterase [Fredinandcohnia quinoae]|uniref:RNA 2',3'-cyclic phosphodiesterase n=1 Tax=Fredinandcohnia quinoae TaxID=2918902 RepID=A0AAW5DZ57_9BACI|nr:RNA 2',3'-cyclic phosphodiesterase [Fredinandcohnia sp. SECRCQ15]MCH1625363.1 RNA 2',3'-cyclic phosphodiesterase [Fredinandcohnia sp. SECRCQ15]
MNKMEHQTHYFLALALPNQTKALLAKWCELLDPRLSFKSWVHPEDYHITLAFLGGSSSFAQLNNVKREMNSISKQHDRFQLQLNQIGTFGRTESPRVFWAGVNESKELSALQRDVHHACTNLGFSLDQRPYNPHITMARKWNSEQLFPAHTIESIVQPKEELCIFTAEHIVLYQTHMTRVPKYQPLSIFPLQ